MTSPALVEAAAITIQGGSFAPGAAELPAHSRSVDAADFERLMAQAHAEQAHVELANPANSVGQKSMGSVTKAISASSQEYRNTVDAGVSSLAQMDFKNPASVANVVQHFTQVAAQGVQLTVMLGEVSNAKKSVTELFHNQG
jgi:hypothetical protein